MLAHIPRRPPHIADLVLVRRMPPHPESNAMPKMSDAPLETSSSASLLDTIVPRRRRAPSTKARRIIFQKTGGLCHVCGGALDEHWTADHVKPFAKGGQSDIDNFLPACSICNRLKWHRTPEVIRFIMQLGIYARKQIEHDTPLGRQIAALFKRREATNLSRRKPRQTPNPAMQLTGSGCHVSCSPSAAGDAPASAGS